LVGFYELFVPEFVAVKDVLGNNKLEKQVRRIAAKRRMYLAEDQIRNATINEKVIMSTKNGWMAINK